LKAYDQTVLILREIAHKFAVAIMNKLRHSPGCCRIEKRISGGKMDTNKYSFNRGYGHMVLDYYVETVRTISLERKRRIGEIRNRKQAEKYRENVLTAIKKSFPFPPVKTPLNPEVTGLLEKDGYRIEKVAFESRPGCLVTGNLYLPSEMRKPAPGVLAPCGHSGIGKAENFYQQFCLRLAKSGFAVLIYDPINQGERDQYFRLPKKEAVRRNCCQAHNMMGKQMELLGDSFGAWRAWDGIRALDYLVSRPEVDRKVIGLTGNSGGGTLTTWLWALDDRFTMAAPSCFVTTFLANLENELPADNEQYPPGIMDAGVEEGDFFMARAPKPVLLLGQQYDFFDRRGLKGTYEEVKRFYGLFETKKNAALFTGGNTHGYFPDNQKKMLEFFCRHAGLKPYRKDVAALVEKPEKLWVTKKGQVVPAGSKPVYEMLAETAKKTAAARKKLSGKDTARAIKEILNIQMPVTIPHYRILRPAVEGENITARYAVETERNIRAILHKRLTETTHGGTLDVEKTVRLFIPHFSAEEDMKNDLLAKKLEKKGPLYCLDVRGLGESLPDEHLEFFHPYGKDYMFHGHSLMLGQSYMGRRVHDILQVLKLLEKEGAREIYLYGRGQGGILALLAAVLHGNIKKTVLKNAPSSFYEWTQKPVVAWPAANFPRGILKKLDIPDCLRVLGKKVEIIEPWGPDMKPAKKHYFK